MATVKKSVKKAQTGASTPKKKAVDSVRSEMFPGKMIPKSKSNFENRNFDKTANATKGTSKLPTMIKKSKSGGSFPDLNKDGKITKKDILIGKGVLPKTAKKGMKVKKASFGDFMKGAIKMGSKIKGAADSARGAIGSAVLGMPGAKPIAKKGMKMKKAKTGISVPKNTSVSKNIGNLNKAKKGASIKKCKYGCK